MQYTYIWKSLSEFGCPCTWTCKCEWKCKCECDFKHECARSAHTCESSSCCVHFDPYTFGISFILCCFGSAAEGVGMGTAGPLGDGLHPQEDRAPGRPAVRPPARAAARPPARPPAVPPARPPARTPARPPPSSASRLPVRPPVRSRTSPQHHAKHQKKTEEGYVAHCTVVDATPLQLFSASLYVCICV
jgi:hypothetical protein